MQQSQGSMDRFGVLESGTSVATDAIVIVPLASEAISAGQPTVVQSRLPNSDAVVIMPQHLPTVPPAANHLQALASVAVGMSAGHVSSGQAMPSTSAAPPSYTQGSFVGGKCHHEDRVPVEPPVVQVHSLHITQADEGDAPNLPLNATSIPPPPSSPQEIDQAIYDQGRELHELLHLFKQATTEPLAALSSKLRSTRPSLRHIPLQCLLLRQLPTGAVQDLKEKLVRESLSSRWRRTLWQKKCGTQNDEQDLHSATLQQYMDMYKHPLTEGSIEAITTLIDVAVEKKKKKDKKKNIADAGIKATKDDSNKTSNTAPSRVVGEKPDDGPTSSCFCVQP
jgi:hypothetical protein